MAASAGGRKASMQVTTVAAEDEMARPAGVFSQLGRLVAERRLAPLLHVAVEAAAVVGTKVTTGDQKEDSVI